MLRLRCGARRTGTRRLVSYACLALVLSCLFLRTEAGLSQTSSRDVQARAATLPAVGTDEEPRSTRTVVLVQSDGEVDTVKSWNFALPPPLQVSDVEFVQTSSNSAVFACEDNQNMLISTGANGQSVNLTVSNSFDAMAGKTDYSVVCRRKEDGEILFSRTIHYVICGLSFFRTPNYGEDAVVSGAQSSYAITYEDALGAAFSPANRIGVFVQYPDGTTSANTTAGPLPKQDGLSITAADARAQFYHDAITCNMGQVGAYDASAGLSLPAGCGYGLYRDEGGNLCFGVSYVPYRAGSMSFDVSWDSLVDSVPALAEDGFSEKLHMSVTGLPPVVVAKVEPLGFLFRPEGGQAVRVRFFNGDLRPSSPRQMVVENATSPFKELYGSYVDSGAPSYSQTAVYITEAGSGSNLPFTFQYLATETGAAATFYTAKVGPDVAFTVTYDTRPIKIDSISPAIGLESGGQTMVVKGYFAGFDKTVDGLYFNGVRVPTKYYTTVSDTTLELTLPPKSEFGDGYDYGVQVRIGYAQSPVITFQYTVTYAEVSISQSGTTQLPGDDVYRLGDCSPGRMTAVVSPFTSQVQSYEWSLTEVTTADASPELLSTLTNPAVRRSTQTVELQPAHLAVGHIYELRVKATMPGAVAVTTITIVRENAVTVGAYILEPPVRSIAYPETPLRLSAIVRTPSDGCYNGTQGLVFEWTGFGKTQRYSPGDATGEVTGTGEIVTTAARLGWEFLVPQGELTVGDHEVTFKTWMGSNPLVSGSAQRVVKIVHSPLQAVIRGGESGMTANGNTSIVMSAANSVDPDQAHGGRGSTSTAALTYQWSCIETAGAADFSDEAATSACDSGFMPDGSQAQEFTIPKELITALPDDVKALRYRLIVMTEGRLSRPSTLTIFVESGTGKQSHLVDYTMQVQDANREAQDMQNVKYYQPIVLDVTSTVDDVSWTYEVVDPPMQTVLTASNLIQTPAYYSPDATSTSGNRKSLGFEAFKLRPYTAYTVKVSFTGSASYEDTEVLVTFKTSQSPALNFPEPSVMSGTTLTQYTATAGIPQDDSQYSYYFVMQDDAGKYFCIGGCTGYSISYFRIGNPGSYQLSVLLYDSQGKALLSRQVLSNPIVVSAPDVEHDLFSELSVLFANGDDSSWTQLAYDLTNTLLADSSANSAPPSPSTAAPLATTAAATDSTTAATESTTAATESTTAATDSTTAASPVESPTSVVLSATDVRMPRRSEGVGMHVRQGVADVEKVTALGNGLRKIICASRPSTGHGALAVAVATRLSALPSISRDTFYDITGTVGCCVRNTPKGTTTSFKLPDLLTHLERHVANAAGGSGSGRRRLLQTEDAKEPNNLRADLNCWSGKMVTATVTSSQSEGYTETLMDGQFTVAVVANQVQLPVVEVNGVRQNGMEAGSADEGIVFYAKGACAGDLFSEKGDQKRFLAVQAMSNFVTEDGFQSSPPPGGFLSDALFLTQVYKEDAFGNIEAVEIAERQDSDPCFCHKLPIKHKLDELNEQLGSAPSMFSLTDKKPYKVDPTASDEYFNYVVDEAETLAYNIKRDGSHSWVEVCSRGVGFVGSTITSRSGLSANAGGANLFGKEGAGIVGMVLAGLIFVVVAVVASWVVATRSLASGAPAPVALAAHELYVERDIYGRGTIFGPNKAGAAAARAEPVAR